jgi:ADP-heptose:LPS heptosyltransferase
LPATFDTEPATIPSGVPYIRPYGSYLDKWRDRLPASGRLRVGLCWACSGAHVNNRRRSLSLQYFAKILAVANVDFVSLQKEVSPEHDAILRDKGVIQLARGFQDFADTAAVVALLDLIITVDTAVAHLAGAMGKATAVLLPFAPDFRWQLERTDCPWYPTLRLFRQTAIGDWDAPLERLHHELLGITQRRGQAR